MTGENVSNVGNSSCPEDTRKSVDKGEDMPGFDIVHVEIPQPADQITLQRKVRDITVFSNVQFENYGHLK